MVKSFSEVLYILRNGVYLNTIYAHAYTGGAVSFNGAHSEVSHPVVVREQNWRLNVGGMIVPSWFCLFSLPCPPVTKAMFFCTCPLNVAELALLCLFV